MNYQSIRDLDVINVMPLGQEIQKFGQKTIEFILRKKDCGWLDGGCHIFAHAMKEVFEENGITSHIMSVGRNGHQDHAIVAVNTQKYGTLFIDSDGIGNEKDIIKKMEKLELVTPSIIQEYLCPFEEKDLAYQMSKKMKKDSNLIAKIEQFKKDITVPSNKIVKEYDTIASKNKESKITLEH